MVWKRLNIGGFVGPRKAVSETGEFSANTGSRQQAGSFSPTSTDRDFSTFEQGTGESGAAKGPSAPCIKAPSH